MEEKRVKLSIIVPVYNMTADGKLAYCLDSLVHQNCEDFEVIAVDDASTDDSFRMLQEYERQYPHCFRAMRLAENHRQGGAKNKGLDEARGDFVGFVDSDDWVHPDMFARLLRLAEDTGADVAGCDFCLTDCHSMEPTDCCHNNSAEQTGKLGAAQYKSLILDSGSLVIKIFAKELFEQPRLRFPEHIFYEDNAISTILMLRAKHFEYIDEPLYYYYQHNTSTVHTLSEERCFDRMKAMEIMLQEVTVGGYLEAYRQEIEYRFANLFYVNTLFSYMQGSQRKRAGFIRDMGRRMREVFPEFQQNPYYLEKTDAEGRKLIALQQKSTLLFLCYYGALHLVRRVKARGK